MDFPSKIQFSKNSLKDCRNTSFDEWNKEFCQKIFSEQFNFPKPALKFVETLLLMSGTKNFAKKYFLSTF